MVAPGYGYGIVAMAPLAMAGHNHDDSTINIVVSITIAITLYCSRTLLHPFPQFLPSGLRWPSFRPSFHTSGRTGLLLALRTPRSSPLQQ